MMQTVNQCPDGRQAQDMQTQSHTEETPRALYLWDHSACQVPGLQELP